jgi:hypothetical protein
MGLMEDFYGRQATLKVQVLDTYLASVSFSKCALLSGAQTCS